MRYQFTVFALPSFITIAALILLIGWVWKRRSSQTETLFLWLVAAIIYWLFGYGWELLSADLPTITFWARFQYPGIAFTPALWLLFVLAYLRRDTWLRPANLALLLTVPGITSLLAFSNAWHGLLWQQVAMDSGGPLPLFQPTYGLWFWVHLVYSYSVSWFGAFLLVRAAVHTPRIYRSQIILLLLAWLLPAAANIIFVFDLSPLAGYDLTPVCFGLSVLLVAWNLFRFRLLDIVPAAHDKVIESLRDGIVVIDAKDRVVDYNAAAARLTGCLRPNDIGRATTEVFAACPQVAEVRAESTRDVYGELTIQGGRDEPDRHIEMLISPLRNAQQQLAGRVVVLRDVSRRRSLTQRQIALARDWERSEALERFASRISGDVQGVVMSMKLQLHEARKKALSNPQAALGYLNRLEAQLDGLHTTIADVITTAQDADELSSGPLNTLDVTDLVQQSLQDVAPMILSKQHRLVLELEEVLPPARADALNLQRALTGILSNAVEYTPPYGMITVRTYEKHQHLVIEVTDTGVGIESDQLPYIFERYAPPNSNGSGLGLSLSRRIIELHNGSIEVESSPGQGSLFRVLLPACPYALLPR